MTLAMLLTMEHALPIMAGQQQNIMKPRQGKPERKRAKAGGLASARNRRVQTVSRVKERQVTGTVTQKVFEARPVVDLTAPQWETSIAREQC